MIPMFFVTLAAVALTIVSPSFAGPGESAAGVALGSMDASPTLLNVPVSQECGPASPAPCPASSDAAGAPPGKGAKATALSNPGKSSSTLLPVGSPSVAFALQDLEGRRFAFEPGSLPKPALVIFWSLFCEPCKEEFPMYGWLLEQYGPKGLDAVAVNIDGPAMATAAKRYLKMTGASLKVLMDRKDGKRLITTEAYGVTGTPSLFLIDKTGTVRWSHAGRVSVEQIEAAIRQTLGS